MYPTEKDNIVVWDGKRRGWYEVWYYKLNDPASATAVWLRSTLLVPLPGRGDPVGELWAIAFDGNDPQKNCAFKTTLPMREVNLGRDTFRVVIGGSSLTHDASHGRIGEGTNGISWDLRVTPAETTFRHFPAALMYRLPLPKTKILSPNLTCRFTGTVTVKDRTLAFDNAPGHQAHIWGTKHAARWAWANCNAFTGRDAVLEALTAQIKIGPKLAPPLSVFHLRIPEGGFTFNRPADLFMSKSSYDLKRWDVTAENTTHVLHVNIRNSPANMVGVGYRDPDGETRVCHNTKVCDVDVELLAKERGSRSRVAALSARGTCAFEVVEPEALPGVRVMI